MYHNWCPSSLCWCLIICGNPSLRSRFDYVSLLFVFCPFFSFMVVRSFVITLAYSRTLSLFAEAYFRHAFKSSTITFRHNMTTRLRWCYRDPFHFLISGNQNACPRFVYIENNDTFAFTFCYSNPPFFSLHESLCAAHLIFSTSWIIESVVGFVMCQAAFP